MKIKKTIKELLVLLASSLSAFAIYIFVLGAVAVLNEYLEESPFAKAIVDLLMGALYAYALSKCHVGYKYSIKGKGDNAIIKEYKDKKMGGMVAQIKELLGKELCFVIAMATLTIIVIIIPQLSFLQVGVNALDKVMNRVLGGALSYILILTFYFLNLYLYRRKIYTEYCQNGDGLPL